MSNLDAARTQMALSLAFHIVFAVVGMAMPLLMVLAEVRALRRQGEEREICLELARRWSRGTAILFAVGAVSGTVLSFELGLLWPGFMKHAGPIIGMPFSLEGFAFFLEAIALGLYLYGWGRLSPRLHVLAGAVVALAGTVSGALVVCANSWMNTPAGFRMTPAGPVDIDPWAAMFNPAALSEGLHMVLAAFAAVGLAVAGVHAMVLLRARRAGQRPHPMHRPALEIALWVGAVASLLQPLSGDYAAKVVARTQPVKLAAMEGHFRTERDAPLRLFGWPDEAREETRYALEIPMLLSVLAYGDPHAEVTGLSDVPRDLRPPVAVVHVAFQIMILCGGAMALVSIWSLSLLVRRRAPAERPALLWAVALAAPLGVLAIEAGWVVTEVGRQPWIIQGVQRTAAAVTEVPNMQASLLCYVLVYLGLSVVVVHLLRKHVFLSVAP
jgi:cytochrome d ubiquinol oxidase subunit I